MTSTTDVEEILRSTNGKEHFQRLTRLLMCGGVNVLRETFDTFHPPKDLSTTLKDVKVQTQLKKAKPTVDEKNCLNQSAVKSTDFDITLTYRLLRTICNLKPPATGWDNKPDDTNHSLEADLARIKYYRNSVYGHNQKIEISDCDFCFLWKEISEAILRIITKVDITKKDEWEKAIEKLLNDPLTLEAQKCIKELKQWYEKKEDVKDILRQVDTNVKDVKEELQHVNKEIKDVKQELKQQGEDFKDVKNELHEATEDVKNGLQQVDEDVKEAKEGVHQVNERVEQMQKKLKDVEKILKEITKAKACIPILLWVSSLLQKGQSITFQEPACYGPERTGSVLLHQELHEPQPLAVEGISCERVQETNQAPPEGPDIEAVISSFKDSFNLFFEYLSQTLGVDVIGHWWGSLFIAVKCTSVEILDESWEDYKSGHLNKVAEEMLIITQVLEKLYLAEVKFETIINEEHYKKCKEFLVNQETIMPRGMQRRRRYRK